MSSSKHSVHALMNTHIRLPISHLLGALCMAPAVLRSRMATCGIPKRQCGLEPQEPHQDHSIYKQGLPQPRYAQDEEQCEGGDQDGKEMDRERWLSSSWRHQWEQGPKSRWKQKQPAAQAHWAGPPSGGSSFLPSAILGHITTAQSPVNTVPRVHNSAVELHVMHNASAADRRRPKAGPTTRPQQDNCLPSAPTAKVCPLWMPHYLCSLFFPLSLWL